MGRLIIRRKTNQTAGSSPSWIKPEDEYEVFGGKDLKPNYQVDRNRRFREPASLMSDWHNNLMEDKPFVNFTFEVIHDWYDKFKEGYEPLYVRAQQTPIDWKSKIGNSDASTNFKTTHEVTIYKGDIVVREDGKLFVLNWAVTNHANNQATQSTECNTWLTIKRVVREITDDRGLIVKEAGEETIVDNLPVVQSEYQGRPDFAANQSQPGITGNHLINITCQFNEQTNRVRLGDTCKIGIFTYVIENINIEQIDIENKYGVITFQARRQAGGVVVGTD